MPSICIGQTSREQTCSPYFPSTKTSSALVTLTTLVAGAILIGLGFNLKGIGAIATISSGAAFIGVATLSFLRFIHLSCKTTTPPIKQKKASKEKPFKPAETQKEPQPTSGNTVPPPIKQKMASKEKPLKPTETQKEPQPTSGNTVPPPIKQKMASKEKPFKPAETQKEPQPTSGNTVPPPIKQKMASKEKPLKPTETQKEPQPTSANTAASPIKQNEASEEKPSKPTETQKEPQPTSANKGTPQKKETVQAKAKTPPPPTNQAKPAKPMNPFTPNTLNNLRRSTKSATVVRTLFPPLQVNQDPSIHLLAEEFIREQIIEFLKNMSQQTLFDSSVILGPEHIPIRLEKFNDQFKERKLQEKGYIDYALSALKGMQEKQTPIESIDTLTYQVASYKFESEEQSIHIKLKLKDM